MGKEGCDQRKRCTVGVEKASIFRLQIELKRSGNNRVTWAPLTTRGKCDSNEPRFRGKKGTIKKIPARVSKK